MWVDAHISQQMLDAHLDPGTDAASRRPAFIDRSVQWIDRKVCRSDKLAQSDKQVKILDLGCGPGLYAQRLAQLGYAVTGVDFSRRSIDYATVRAAELDLPVRYLCADYLDLDLDPDLDLKETFDLVCLIYCDFGVLSPGEQETLLKKVAGLLRPGGAFLVDVFTPQKYNQPVESRDWSVSAAGFWRPGPHLCLHSSYWYSEEKVLLDQYVVLGDGEDFDVYNIWDKAFTCDEIRGLLSRFGFGDFAFYSDVTGKDYAKDSETLCVLAKKV
jgi:SAM-dependent methyltransferase